MSDNKYQQLIDGYMEAWTADFAPKKICKRRKFSIKKQRKSIKKRS